LWLKTCASSFLSKQTRSTVYPSKGMQVKQCKRLSLPYPFH
jgi:hypothetical protein